MTPTPPTWRKNKEWFFGAQQQCKGRAGPDPEQFRDGFVQWQWRGKMHAAANERFLDIPELLAEINSQGFNLSGSNLGWFHVPGINFKQVSTSGFQNRYIISEWQSAAAFGFCFSCLYKANKEVAFSAQKINVQFS
jgi:hypothetical protein